MRSGAARESVHTAWLGMLRPEGLVVSVPVLEEAGAWAEQPSGVSAAIRELAPGRRLDADTFWDLLSEVLRWPEARLLRGEALAGLEVDAPDLGGALRPDAALRGHGGEPLILVRWSEGPLDRGQGGPAPSAVLDRLLTRNQRPGQDGVRIGLLGNPETLRLVYAPRGEAPGALSFPVEALVSADGRILVNALLMLLGVDRLFGVPPDRDLPALLRKSRERQQEVTETLSAQVREALDHLARGLGEAARAEPRLDSLLRDLDPKTLHEGLVTVMLRLVFLLYAEDQALLPTDDPVYQESYSLSGLAERLLIERDLHQEAMRWRYGAWSQLAALFRLVHEGARHGGLDLMARGGDLFDPRPYAFLEGRPALSAPPRVPDAAVAEALERLTRIKGERLSYRNLDVEQLGSVYESLMELRVVRCGSAALRLAGGGLVYPADLDEDEDPLPRLAEVTGLKPAELKRRVSLDPRPAGPEGWARALGGLVRPHDPAAPDPPWAPPGAIALVSDGARRASGSHYTPRDLTRRVVERALGPLLDKGEEPLRSADVLDLRVCDPAMGSGAFLVAACRFLAERLAACWAAEGAVTPGTAGADPLLWARRRVAESCLYGVDKNPFAVRLARLSLWLVTLARDLPFTFLDHALVEGDALMGLSLPQMEQFSLNPSGQQSLVFRQSLGKAFRERAKIFRDQGYLFKRDALENANALVAGEARMGDALLAAVYAGGSAKAMQERVSTCKVLMERWYQQADPAYPLPELCDRLLEEMPFHPLHWELAFPEIFWERKGFDALIGNPPFGGKNNITSANGQNYITLFQALHPHVHGNSDLCAYFFLRVADMLRPGGRFGLVATNTIKQGDTRDSGLKHLVDNGVEIVAADTDQPWAGSAAVIVDVVWGVKGKSAESKLLNGKDVGRINSSLMEGEEIAEPVELKENAEIAFQGSTILGTGFLMVPAEAEQLIAKNVHNAYILRPYMGGDELNSSPDQTPSRWVIDFGSKELEDAEKWPDLIAIVREKVKPQRDTNNRENYRRLWWQFGERRPGLYRRLSKLSETLGSAGWLPRCLVTSRHSKHHLIVFQPIDIVFSEATVVFALSDNVSFAVLQSCVHEAWVRNAGLTSSIKTDVRYTPSTCFETFPFPRPTPGLHSELDQVGEQFEQARAALCRAWRLGLTRLYNRLFDPSDEAPELLRLRALRERMDELVLDVYGWTDLRPDQTAEIVTRLRRLNATRAAGKPDPRPPRGVTPAPRTPMAPPSPALRHLSVRNLKLIRELELSLMVKRAPAQVVAFIGENGTGKTALLQAAALALAGPQLGSAVGGAVLPGLPDRRGKAPMTIKATLGWDEPATHTDGARQVVSGIRLEPGAQLLKGRAQVTQPPSNSDEAPDPLAEARTFRRPGWFVAGYGVSRALPAPSPNPSDEAPGAALRGLFEPVQLVATNWFYWLERRDPTLKGQYRALLSAVLRAAEDLLPGLHEIDPDATGGLNQSEMMRVRWSPVPGLSLHLPAVWLSHGYQSTLAWLSDLLGRLVLEHADAGAPDLEHLTGVVLIDEIDLFLHPTWQVAVVRALKTCLPGMQFLITTHSPLVLAGLRPDQDKIVHLSLDEEANVVIAREDPKLDPRLMTSAELLERYFQIDDVHPDPVGRVLRRVHQLGSFGGRTDAQEAELQEGLAYLEKEQVKPFIPILPRSQA